jgi:hypothetical protein
MEGSFIFHFPSHLSFAIAADQFGQWQMTNVMENGKCSDH